MPTELHRAVRPGLVALLATTIAGCGLSTSSPPADDQAPVHLEERLEGAKIEGSQPAATEEPNLAWRFDVPDPGWRPIAPPGIEAVAPRWVDGALRLELTDAHPHGSNGDLNEGLVFTELPGLDFDDYGALEITARSVGIRNMGLMFNYSEDDPAYPDDVPFFSPGGMVGLVSDGTEQTYRIPLETANRRPWEGPWTEVALWFNALKTSGTAVLELTSMRLAPKEAEYDSTPAGVRRVGPDRRGESGLPGSRRSLFMHTPGEITFRLVVPVGGRLDFGVGVLGRKAPVRFSVSARSDGAEPRRLFDEVHSNGLDWSQHSVDLSRLGGETVDLALSVDSERPGTVAFWGSPTISGDRAVDRPNIILYVIDGAGADYVSAYGYPRHTTPNLERLAAAGALFERAHSNSGWTRPSTASFLTSLQHSSLGGLVRGRNVVPETVPTLAERLHAAGYQTALLTTNSNAGSISGLDRGNDVFREAPTENFSISSAELQGNFEAWREAYPGEPYYVHFQTTDVHNPHTPVPPFSGLFLDPASRRATDEITEHAEELPEAEESSYNEALKLVGADPTKYWIDQRSLHDECMAHQDAQIGKLVARLRQTGEWKRTILIIASDHSVAAGSWDYGLMMRDPTPEHLYHDDPGTPILRSGVSRIPLIVVWPGRVPPGTRSSQPVSMLDLVPTVLQLAGLAPAEIAQGRSMADHLLDDSAPPTEPVFLDDFEVDENGWFSGRIEIIDGRWGASLYVDEDPEADPTGPRSSPLLLYDLWNDPFCLHSLHEEHPHLVEEYTRRLEQQFRAHRDLGRLFEPGETSPLTPEQLEGLRALGYIQ